ncbi:hypothetical protein ACHQM5_029314 [Ranunculus cassubicifolius]
MGNSFCVICGCVDKRRLTRFVCSVAFFFSGFDLMIYVCFRNLVILKEKGDALVSKLGENSEFVEVDIENVRALESALRDVDLVVHAAGPFQRAEKCTVLEAAISTKTAYMDVCNDADYSIQAKSFHEKAVAANIPAITTAGIYPGVSNVMAAELVRSARDENIGEPQRLRFSYYTAGTGGVGPTILATSFLLLGEEVVAYSKGEEVKLKPYSGKVNVDFGKGIGKRDVYLLNLPEVRSIHKILEVPTVSARFGTAPFFWNWGMLAMTLVPSVRSLFSLSRCHFNLGGSTFWFYEGLLQTAAFALAILEGSTQPGVWFPEEWVVEPWNPSRIQVFFWEELLQYNNLYIKSWRFYFVSTLSYEWSVVL